MAFFFQAKFIPTIAHMIHPFKRHFVLRFYLLLPIFPILVFLDLARPFNTLHDLASLDLTGSNLL